MILRLFHQTLPELDNSLRNKINGDEQKTGIRVTDETAKRFCLTKQQL